MKIQDILTMFELAHDSEHITIWKCSSENCADVFLLDHQRHRHTFQTIVFCKYDDTYRVFVDNADKMFEYKSDEDISCRFVKCYKRPSIKRP